MKTLTIKINDSQSIDFLIELLSKFSFVEEIETETIQMKIQSIQSSLPIRPASGKPSISDFAGMWQDNPKTLEQIRNKAWKRTM